MTQQLTETQVGSLPLPHAVKASLAEAGYKHVRDLTGISASELSAELSIGIQQAEDVLRHITPTSNPEGNGGLPAGHVHGTGPPHSPVKSATAAELLSASARHRFSTLCPAIDRLISHFSPLSVGPSVRTGVEGGYGGYIVPGMSVEISSPPGGGKSVLAVALALSARLKGEAGGEVLFVDTEGGVTPARLRLAAESLSRTQEVTSAEMLKGIHLMRVATQVQMVAFLLTLEEWLDQHQKVRLIVIDTLSYHFRQPMLDMSTRRRMMDMVKQKIGKATTVYQCAVVITNQLATKLLTAENKPANFETGDRAILMPQLGDLWTMGKTLRIVLFRGGPGDGMRYAHATTASGGGESVAPWATFDIDADGLPCDIPSLEV